MFSESTPRTRAAKRDAIAAKFEGRKPLKISVNPSVLAGMAILAALAVTGWVEGMEALPLTPMWP